MSAPVAEPIAPAKGRLRWGSIATIVAVLGVVLAVCGALGLWQWRVGTEQGEVIETAASAPVPLADVIAPATAAQAIGTAVTAGGGYADADAALVGGGREIDGVEAVLVVRPFTVAADLSGTGESATLPVVVGWLPADDVHTLGAPPATTAVAGYLRGAEGASAAVTDPAPDGTFWSTTLSPAVFAQHWDSPLYSALLVANEPEPGLNAIPAPEPEHELNFRSIVYALEWWLFGAFFLFVGVRWIRDNGRVSVAASDPVEEGTP